MSKITVTTIAGQTSGADANTVKIESGDDFVVDTNVLKVDSTNNRVGIGTASPTQATLHVAGGGVPARFESTSSATTYVQFGASGTSNYGQVAMNGNDMTLRTAYTDRMKIDGSGNIMAPAITLGNGTTYAAANTLDDYEEGTWTATLGGSGSDPTVSSYSYNSGHYTKIGRQVFAHIYMRIEAGGISGGSGDGIIKGLPFTAKSDGQISNGVGGWIENYWSTSTSFSSGRNYPTLYLGAGSNYIGIWQKSTNDPTQYTGWSLGQIDDAAFLVGGVLVYMTA